MNTELFEAIKDSKMKKIYQSLWKDNQVVNTAKIEKSIARKDSATGKTIYSNNSYSFAGEDKANVLISVFGIPEESRELFRRKLKMACGGSRQEYRRITTLHSSSLCALLFFYNVTENNPLKIDGVGTFTKSVFEFKSPVVDENHHSCMDVVLIGKSNSGESILLFLESKFSEYYTSASKKLYNISECYLINDYSKSLYAEDFLNTINIRKTTIKGKFFDLYTDDEFYIGGIKQMISHYVGIRNNLNQECDFSKQEEKEQYDVIDLIKEGAKVYLAEILFDSVIGDMKLGSGKTCKDAYSEKYEVLAMKLNKEIQNSNVAERFFVLPHELCYSIFKDNALGFNVNKNILSFYFG